MNKPRPGTGNGSRECLRPVKERAWGLPAAANVILGGAGAGLYLIGFIQRVAGEVGAQGGLSGLPGIAAGVMVGLGFLSVSFESGRPLRGIYLLGNLRTSWMSCEMATGMIFVVSAVAHILLSRPVFMGVAACAALALLISQGCMFFRAKAMTAWSVPVIPPLFLTSALVLGAGILLAAGGLRMLGIDETVLAIAIVCLIGDAALWVVYVWLPRGRYLRLATEYMRRPLPVFSMSVIGHLVPLLLLTMIVEGPSDSWTRHPAIALSGFCMIAGGVAQKILIILGANIRRGVIIERPGINSIAAKTETRTFRPGRGGKRCETLAGER